MTLPIEIQRNQKPYFAEGTALWERSHTPQ
jgi:hypothetical protein